MKPCLLFLIASCLFVSARCRAGGPTEQTVTVLFNEHSVEISDALVDGEQLWVAADQVHKVNGFDPKPEGFCTADVCISIPKSTDWRMQHNGKDYFNVTRFAEKVDQTVAIAQSKATWSFSVVPIQRSELLQSRIAPDFELPDRNGNVVKLSDFRGNKVLILTWASW